VDERTQKPAALRARPEMPAARLLALLMAMTAIGPLSLNILVPALPTLVLVFATDAATAQLAVSLFILGLAVAQLALGPLSDRYGRKPIVLAGLALTVLSSAIGMAATGIGFVIAARVVQALGASTGLVIGRAIVRDLYEREHAAAMIGWVTTAMVVAPMVAPLIGGILDTAIGWEATFAFVALASGSVLAWAWRTLPETKPDHVTSAGFRHLASDARLLGRDATFWGYVLVAGLGTATFFVFLGGAPHAVISIMGRSSAEYGAWFMVNAFGYMMGNVVAARLAPRFGLEPLIHAGIALEVAGAVVAVAATWLASDAGPAILFFPQAMISFGNGVLLPNAMAGAVSVRPQAAGTASGMAGFVQMGLGAISAQAGAWLVGDAESAMPMSLAMLVVAAGTGLSALLVRRGTGRH
jgi:DHA1 family bicyclomycin/chloramphenicol resistance-like MFS transporter